MLKLVLLVLSLFSLVPQSTPKGDLLPPDCVPGNCK